MTKKEAAEVVLRSARLILEVRENLTDLQDELYNVDEELKAVRRPLNNIANGTGHNHPVFIKRLRDAVSAMESPDTQEALDVIQEALEKSKE